MDPYVKRLKRVGVSARTNKGTGREAELQPPPLPSPPSPPLVIRRRQPVEEFFFPGVDVVVGAGDAAAAGAPVAGPSAGMEVEFTDDSPKPPPTPQKKAPIQSMTPSPSPIRTPSEYCKKMMEQSARKNASRRLIFDDEKPLNNSFVSAYEDLLSGDILFPEVMKTLNKSQNTDIFEEKILPNSHSAVPSSLIDSMANTSISSFSNVFENLSKRGFIVQNNGSFGEYGNFNASDYSAKTTELKVDNESSLCSQFECLSLLEGGVYSIRAVATAKIADSLRSVKALASIGSHPHIISYFSSWTDGCFHYVQTEFCSDNLQSLKRDCFYSSTNYQIILEHMSSALHYLHDMKKYVHNMVVGQNIFRSIREGDRVVFKLGGFDHVTELLDDDKTAPLIDIKSLCATVLLLLKDHGYDGETDDEDLKLLIKYLSTITKMIGDLTEEPATVDQSSKIMKSLPSDYVNARNIWLWCCSSRLQHLQQRPQNLMFETSASNTNCDGIRFKLTD